MKKYSFLMILTALIILTLTDQGYTKLDYTKNQLLKQFLFNSLKIWHFSPSVVNDDLSVKSFKLFVKKLDPGKKFLLEDDIEKLKKFEKQIDDDINQNRNIILPFSIKLLQNRIKFVQSVFQEILEKPFNFNKKEHFETSFKKRKFVKTDAEIKELWRKILKYQTLFRYQEIVLERIKKADKEKSNKKTSDKEIESVPQFDPEIEKEAREKVAKSIKRQLKRLLEIKSNEHLAMFLNSIMNCFDPHTVYFLPKAKEDFDIESEQNILYLEKYLL